MKSLCLILSRSDGPAFAVDIAMRKKIIFSLIMFLSVFNSATTFANVSACRYLFPSAKISTSAQITVNRYLETTLNSLNLMRGQNGLLRDAVWIKNNIDKSFEIVTLNPDTSPTNIAADLLIHTELLNQLKYKQLAFENLNRTLDTLKKVDFHAPTGLFFSRYSSDTKKPLIKDSSVSSIDNLHLAIALWTISETNSGNALGKKALNLFKRMDFSIYYDRQSGLIGGNLRKENDQWIRETYNFANLGSEARLLYSAGYALGLFKSITNDAEFLNKAFSQLKLEIFRSPEGPLLKLWDGSAFQLFFPRIFANENLYSRSLEKLFKNKAHFMIADGRRRNLTTPASHSAIRVGTHESIYQGEGSIYRDKGGNLSLVSSDNADVNDPVLRKLWDGAFAPYALVMAAVAAPEMILPELNRLEKQHSGADYLYSQKLGWMEGMHVTGRLTGQVVASQLSLNQGMLALSLLQMDSSDGLSASARAMNANPVIKSKLQKFYQHFDNKVSESLN